jgi:hypothetical protein
MVYLSTTKVAKKLGLAHNTLAQYIRQGKVPAPRASAGGGTSVHLWTEGEIEVVRKLLPKIANGRKTRYQKKEARAQRSATPKPKAKKRKTKEKQ